MAKKGLRTGYTTGSCAAAASKAAAMVLASGKPVSEVDIPLPIGWRATFQVHRCEIGESSVMCSVIKDAGDDPDVTHGAEICSTVAWKEEPGLAIEGGEGVGVVTKPGLGIPIGSPAINGTPRQMIAQALSEVPGLDLATQGLRVTVSVPRGKEIAKRTLNARLGIIGGISILGTTGIVVPYSTEAYKACMSQALDVARAAGLDHVVLTTGGRSEKFAQRLVSLPEEAFIQMGDFVGYALEECVRKGVARATVCAMIGKLSKMAAGEMQTHVSQSQVDLGFLAGLAAKEGVPREMVAAAAGANTARHFAEIVSGENSPAVIQQVCRLAQRRLFEHVNGAVEIECIMVDFEGAVLGRAPFGE